MSSPNQMSRRLLLSSKYALTCTGRPVRAGRGKKQNARPSAAFGDEDEDEDEDASAASGSLGASSGCGTRAATPTHGTRPRRVPTSESASARASPPANELHTIHRSRETRKPENDEDDATSSEDPACFADADFPSSSFSFSSFSSVARDRTVRSIQPTEDGRDASGTSRNFSKNARRFPPATPPSAPATHRSTAARGSFPSSNAGMDASYRRRGSPEPSPVSVSPPVSPPRS